MGRMLLIFIFEIFPGLTNSGLSPPTQQDLFSATEISRLARIFYQFCPSQRCDNTTSDTEVEFPISTISTCCLPQCSCNPLSCRNGKYGPTCCPELLNEVYSYPSCVNTKLKPWKPHQSMPYAYHITSKCNSISFFDIEKEVIDKCDFRDRYDDLDTKIPVADASLVMTFANHYCAKCNGFNKVVPWKPKIQCSMGTLDVLPVETIVDRVRDSTHCQLYYEPPSGKDLYIKFTLLPCGNYISECNMTGNWKTYDKVLELGCKTMHAPFQNTYKNVFCYLCNSDGTLEDMPACTISTPSQPSFSLELTYPITYNRSQQDIDESTCGPYAMYDPFQKSCLEIKCLLYKIYTDEGQCQRTVDRIGGSDLNFLICLKLSPQTDVMADPSVINHLIDQVLENLYNFSMAANEIPLNRTGAGHKNRIATDGLDTEYKIDYLIVYYMIQQPLNSLTGMVEVSSIEQLLKYHGGNMSLESLGNEDQITVLMELDTVDAVLESDEIQPYNEDDSETYFLMYMYLNSSGMETLLPVHDCPLVELNLSIYYLSNGRLGVMNETFSIPVGRNEYLVTHDDTSILTCIDIYDSLIAQSVVVKIPSSGSASNVFNSFVYSLALFLIMKFDG